MGFLAPLIAINAIYQSDILSVILLRNYGGGYGNQWAPHGPPQQWASPQQQWGQQGIKCVIILSCFERTNSKTREPITKCKII